MDVVRLRCRFGRRNLVRFHRSPFLSPSAFRKTSGQPFAPDSGTLDLVLEHRGAATSVARNHSDYSNDLHFIVGNGNGVVTTVTLIRFDDPLLKIPTAFILAPFPPV